MPARLFLMILLLAFAASLVEADSGITGEQFLAIPAGARPAALGDAFAGLADDVHALAYNPAGLAFLRRQELGLVHDAYAGGISHEWIGYAAPTPIGAFGLAVNALFVAPFDSYDQFDQQAGKTSASDSAYQMSYAARLAPSWALGGTGRYVSSRLAGYRASTWAGDIGVLFRPWKQLRLGASYANFGGGVRYIADSAPLPSIVRFGAAFAPLDPAEYSQTFVVVAEGRKSRYEKPEVGGGLEFWHQNALALRAGGRSGQNTGPGWTMGIGVWLNRGRRDVPEIGFDYAFVDQGELAQTHRGEITVRFGGVSGADPESLWDRADGLYRGPLQRLRREPAPPPPEAAPRRPNLDESRMSDEYIDWVSP